MRVCARWHDALHDANRVCGITGHCPASYCRAADTGRFWRRVFAQIAAAGGEP